MAGSGTNQGLAVALALAVVTGLVMYALGTGWNLWATALHGAAGIVVLALSPWKSAIVRRGLQRRHLRRASVSLLLLAAVALTLVTGYLHRAGGRDLGPLLVMQVHVGAAVVSLVSLLWHMRARPSQFRDNGLDRRAFLRGAALLGGSAAVGLALPHASRRYTRSLERGSFSPTAMPVVQWFDDDVPRLTGGDWELVVGTRTWRLAELEELARSGAGAHSLAALDCTGGWYAWQHWSGVDLRALLDASGIDRGRSVRLESCTGYSRRLPYPDRGDLLVALRADDRPLSPGHGFPARLVAPGRRGFWWVKWLKSIEADDTPWWWQPPFPLT